MCPRRTLSCRAMGKMNMFAKIAILLSLAALDLPALTSQEPNGASSTSQSESGAAPPPTGQSAPPAQAPSSAPQPPVESPPVTQNPPPAAPLPATPQKPVLKRKKHKPAATHTQSGKVVVRNGGVK